MWRTLSTEWMNERSSYPHLLSISQSNKQPTMINTFQWELHPFEATPLRKKTNKPLSEVAFETLKDQIFQLILHKKHDSHLVIRFKGNRFLSEEQAATLTEALEAIPNVSVQSLTKKEMILSNNHGVSITLIIACGTSNFDTGPTKKKKKMTKEERAKARKRAQEAMMTSAAAVKKKKPVAKVIAKIVSEIAAKDGEETEEESPEEEVEHDAVARPAAATAPAVNADGDGPLTQLWYGAFDVEIDSMLKDLSL